MSAFDVRDIMNAVGPSSAYAEAAMPALKRPAARPRAMSPLVLCGTVRILEGAALLGFGVLLYAVMLHGRIASVATYAAAICLVPAVTIALAQAAGAYRLPALRQFVRTAIRLTAAWTTTFLILAALLVLAKLADQTSRLWLATYYAGGLALLLGGRIAVSRYVETQARAGRFDRRAAIVGGGDAGEELIKALSAQPESGISIVGVFDDRNDDRSTDTVAGVPKLGNVDQLVNYARNHHLDLIVFTIPISAEGRILQMLAKLWVLPIDIRLSAHATKLRLRPRSYSYLGSVPVLDVFDKPIADWDVVVKAAFDRVVAFLALVALSPVMLAIALTVKLTSRGPILFKQQRLGFNNEVIEVYKFRSMYTDLCDVAGQRTVSRGDPRVTPFGRLIRKSSMDELPQLLNVLKGDLSLVGPRPHVLHAKTADTLYDQVVDGYFARHRVKPGMTGWAQINGWRGQTDTEEKLQRRVEHDLYYIENWSVLFDIQILAMTPFALLKAENAF